MFAKRLFGGGTGTSASPEDRGLDVAAKLRFGLRQEVGSDDVALLVEPASYVKEGKVTLRGRLVVSTASIVFVPDTATEPKVVVARKDGMLGAAEETGVRFDTKENSFRFGVSREAAVRLRAELSPPPAKSSKSSERASDGISPQQMDLINSNAFGTLLLNCMKAKNLLAMDASGKSDPFVRATLLYAMPGKDKDKELAETTLQTKYVEQSLTPKWNETLAWDVLDAMPSAIKIRVYDYDEIGSNDLIGHCVVPVVRSKDPREQWVTLGTEAGLNVVNMFKTNWAHGRKTAEAAKTALGGKKKLAAKAAVQAANSNNESAIEGAEPMDDEHQWIQVATWWRRATMVAASLLSNESVVVGALGCFDSRFAFVSEQQQVLLEVEYERVVSFRYVKKYAVLETSDSIFVFGSVQKAVFQALFAQTSIRYGAAPPFAKKGTPQRMPSVRDLKGLTPFPMGKLEVTVIEGMQLIAKDKIKGEYTSSDPYVIISIVDASGSPVHGGAETRPVSRSLMPVWDQDFALWVPQGATAIVFTVMDKDPGGKQGDDFMGQALVTGDEFRKLAADSGAWEGWRKLEQRPGRNERVSGKIRISLKMDPNALMEKEEGGPSFGIDMFQPTRRDSVTRLDFDLCNKFNTFKGMFKGEPCRIWVSDEGVAAFGQHVKLRLTWNELTSVTRVEQPGSHKQVDRGLLLRGPMREVYIHEPDINGLERLEKTFQRYREAVERTARKAAGDPPSTMSFFRMHPFFTQLVHGALVGRHTKMLVCVWLCVSVALYTVFNMHMPVTPRLCLFVAVLSWLSWLAEHVELELDWESLIREADYPLVELDLLDMAGGRNISNSTRLALVLFGVLFAVTGSLPTVDWRLLAFPFVACLLVVVRTMLKFIK